MTDKPVWLAKIASHPKLTEAHHEVAETISRGDGSTDRRQVLRDSRIRLVLHCPPRGTTTQTKVIGWEIQVPEEWPATEVVEIPRDPAFEARVAASKARRSR